MHRVRLKAVGRNWAERLLWAALKQPLEVITVAVVLSDPYIQKYKLRR